MRRQGDEVVFRAIDPGAFGFRRALGAGTSLGVAAERALEVDPAFDLARALAALFEDGLVVGFTCPSRTGENEPCRIQP